MKVDDILEWQCPRFPDVVHRWRVVGIHIGGTGQESLIEAESITHQPGWTGQWEYHPRVFIPEPLTRGLKNLTSEHTPEGADMIEGLERAQELVRSEHDRLSREHALLPTGWFGRATKQHHRHHAAIMACARVHTYLHEEISRLKGTKPLAREASGAFSERYPDMAGSPYLLMKPEAYARKEQT